MDKLLNCTVIIIIVMMSIMSCQESEIPERASIRNLTPRYDDVSLMLASDTLHFPLSDTTFNSIKSLNYFNDHGADYLCIYDERSGSVNIYDLYSKQMVKKILPLKKMPDKRLYKTTVYCRNFDSLFICNNEKKFYLLDSSGRIKNAAKISDEHIKSVVWLENSNPVVLKDSLLMAGIRPSATISSIKKARKWRIMYQFNLLKSKKARIYQLPARYLNNNYDYEFLNYSYCFNNNCRFVFSFPADSNLYETDLVNLHIAHFAKSQWQQGDIMPLLKKSSDGISDSKPALTRDFYGAVYFDPYHKRYLRCFKRKLNEPDHSTEKNSRKSTVLIFNENLQIIGETDWPEGASFSTLFFTRDGRMYARVNKKDENALHFVRLIYKENASSELAKQVDRSKE